jgi:hypothetical protein
MKNRSDANLRNAAYQCPACGTDLPSDLVFLDQHCPTCESSLWCYRRVRRGSVILDAIAGRAPALGDLDGFVGWLAKSSGIERVILNLSALDFVTSSYVASVVRLSQRLQSAGANLSVCNRFVQIQKAIEPAPAIRRRQPVRVWAGARRARHFPPSSARQHSADHRNGGRGPGSPGSGPG